MATIFFQVDAFAEVAFAGNPAAVCLLDHRMDEKWMQAVASEMNLSETAFVSRRGDEFDLRWFTPACEVALCGHATLASAHALWETGWLPADREARFHTASGLLIARRKDEGIEMDFPAEPARPIQPPQALLQGLNASAKYVGRNRMDFIVEVEDAATVRNLAPNLALWKQLDTRGVIVTARSDVPAYDFVSRFFGPGAGIDEDPVTGSAHCCLGPYWQERLGKADLKAFQASKRGGSLAVGVRGQRVLLKGRAVTVLRGELLG